jgi:hypothetical protein
MEMTPRSSSWPYTIVAIIITSALLSCTIKGATSTTSNTSASKETTEARDIEDLEAPPEIDDEDLMQTINCSTTPYDDEKEAFDEEPLEDESGWDKHEVSPSGFVSIMPELSFSLKYLRIHDGDDVLGLDAGFRPVIAIKWINYIRHFEVGYSNELKFLFGKKGVKILGDSNYFIVGISTLPYYDWARRFSFRLGPVLNLLHRPNERDLSETVEGYDFRFLEGTFLSPGVRVEINFSFGESTSVVHDLITDTTRTVSSVYNEYNIFYEYTRADEGLDGEGVRGGGRLNMNSFGVDIGPIIFLGRIPGAALIGAFIRLMISLGEDKIREFYLAFNLMSGLNISYDRR